MGASLRKSALGVGAAVLAGSATAQGSSYFGPDVGLQLQPEVQLFYTADPSVRLMLDVQSTLTPDQGRVSLKLGGFADLYFVRSLRQRVSPDEAKNRALTIRVGATYSDSFAPGNVGQTQLVSLQTDVTPRFFLPWFGRQRRSLPLARLRRS